MSRNERVNCVVRPDVPLHRQLHAWNVENEAVVRAGALLSILIVLIVLIGVVLRTGIVDLCHEWRYERRAELCKVKVRYMRCAHKLGRPTFLCTSPRLGRSERDPTTTKRHSRSPIPITASKVFQLHCEYMLMSSVIACEPTGMCFQFIHSSPA